jgi:hypothetical protein
MKKSIRLLALAICLASGRLYAQPQKVILVILENTNYEEAIAQPFLGGVIARQGALATDLHAVGHPSQPNYVALVAGSTLGVHNDSNVRLNARHIGDLLEAKSKSWHVYAEGYPGNCFLGATSGRYARKHNPLVSFINIQNSPDRCANVTDASSFTADFNGRRLADFTMYIPDLDDDGHDTGAKYADNWLSQTFGPLLLNKTAMQDVLLVVTFDEDDDGPTNHIFTAFYGPNVIPGTQLNGHYDHYSLLRTFEDLLGLGSLGQNDAKATPITGFLNPGSEVMRTSRL